MLFNQYASLFEMNTLDSWTSTVFNLSKSYGFDKCLYSVLNSKHDAMENAFIKSNYAPGWHKTYDEKHLASVDPTVQHCLSSNLPLLWEDRTFNGAGQKELYETAKQYGLCSGLIFPIHGARGEFGMMSFVAPQSKFAKSNKEFQHIVRTLSILKDHVFESSLKFIHNREGNKPICLTPRETEVLKWSTAGKSSWEISKILNCSESTVNFHLLNVRHKFDVSTTQLAVIRAIQQGIIHT